MKGLRICPVEQGSKGASHEGSVPSCFLLHWRWSWQLADREGLAIGLRLEMCLQQRLQRLLVLKSNTSEITTTA